jgi:predicted dehydrogenase
MRARLRFGVVGVGHLGKEHARILAGMRGVELVGVADLNGDQAEAVANRVSCRAYANYRPLLHLVDAAVIAVPTTYHHGVAREFLHCGIPTLVEKPLAATLEEAEDLVTVAQQNQTILQVGHIERFNPAYEELQNYSLQPKFIDCQRLGQFSGRSFDTGVVLDLMIHDLDLVLAIVRSEVRSVEALGVSVFGGHEDIANARLAFANGCVANVSASRASLTGRRQMQIWSPEGFVGLDFASRKLTLVQPSADLRRHGLDPTQLPAATRALLKDELFGRHLEILERDCQHAGADALTCELNHFVDCIRQGKEPRVSGVHGRDAMALAGRIIDAIRSHQWDGHADGAVGPSQLPKPHGVWFRPDIGRAAA